jgi:hypothetical protein
MLPRNSRQSNTRCYQSELASKWEARRESALHGRRRGERKRAEGAGPKHRWYSSTGCWSRWLSCVMTCPMPRWPHCSGWTAPRSAGRLGRSGRCWPRGFAVPDRPGIRLRTLGDVFAYAEAEGVELRIDRYRGAGAPPGLGQAGPQGVRLRQAETEHDQDRRVQRWSRPHPVLRGGPARTHARSDRGAHRGHCRTVPAAP